MLHDGRERERAEHEPTVVSRLAIPPRENSWSIASSPVLLTKPVAIAPKIALIAGGDRTEVRFGNESLDRGPLGEAREDAREEGGPEDREERRELQDREQTRSSSGSRFTARC